MKRNGTETHKTYRPFYIRRAHVWTSGPRLSINHVDPIPWLRQEMAAASHWQAVSRAKDAAKEGRGQVGRRQGAEAASLGAQLGRPIQSAAAVPRPARALPRPPDQA
eukprot:scaffold11759_cov46-Prasinocladus_malaysianus.AAC.1